MNIDDLITLKEAAEIVRCTPANLRQAINAKELRGAKRFGKWLVHPSDLRKWAASKTEWSKP